MGTSIKSNLPHNQPPNLHPSSTGFYSIRAGAWNYYSVNAGAKNTPVARVKIHHFVRYGRLSMDVLRSALH